MERLPTPQKKTGGLQGGYFQNDQKKAPGKATQERKSEKAQDTAGDAVEGVNAAAWKERGNAAFKAGDHETAIAAYSKGIEAGNGAQNPENCALYSNRALCAQKLGRFEEAKADAEICVALKPDFPKGYQRGAMALKSLGKPVEAYAFIDKAPPAMVMGNAEIGALHSELKAAAQKEEERRLRTLGGAERGKAQGNILFKKALFEEALKAYTEGLEACTPEERKSDLGVALLNNRAACHHQLSNHREVIRDTEEVLERQPENLKGRLRRMLALEPMEKLREALADARFILAREPTNDMANKVQHRVSKAVRDLDRQEGK